jgi:hypothetical protein
MVKYRMPAQNLHIPPTYWNQSHSELTNKERIMTKYKHITYSSEVNFFRPRSRPRPFKVCNGFILQGVVLFVAVIEKMQWSLLNYS